jgi:hypothetical protein
LFHTTSLPDDPYIVAKACRFPSSYHTPGKGIPASGILDLGLTDNAFCFEINQILRDDGHNYVGIPLCWDALAAEEERGKERVTSLSLTFENESGRSSRWASEYELYHDYFTNMT